MHLVREALIREVSTQKDIVWVETIRLWLYKRTKTSIVSV